MWKKLKEMIIIIMIIKIVGKQLQFKNLFQVQIICGYIVSNMLFDSDTNYSWCVRNNLQRIDNGTGRLGNKRTSKNHPNCNIINRIQRVFETWGDLCLSKSSGQLSANAVVKKSLGVIIMMIITRRDWVVKTIQWKLSKKLVLTIQKMVYLQTRIHLGKWDA